MTVLELIRDNNNVTVNIHKDPRQIDIEVWRGLTDAQIKQLSDSIENADDFVRWHQHGLYQSFWTVEVVKP